MFPYADAQSSLDLHNQRAEELRREATAHRLARSAAAGRHRRFGLRRTRHDQTVRAPAAP